MVMLLAEDGDAGVHAVDPSADASSTGGYGLANGQVDEYPLRDTVPLATALGLVAGALDGRERLDEDWSSL